MRNKYQRKERKSNHKFEVVGGEELLRCYPIGGKWGLEQAVFIEKKGFGEPGRTRTSNPLIKSQLLYH